MENIPKLFGTIESNTTQTGVKPNLSSTAAAAARGRYAKDVDEEEDSDESRVMDQEDIEI